MSISGSVAQSTLSLYPIKNISNEFSESLTDIRTGYLKRIELNSDMLALKSPILSTFNTKSFQLPDYQPAHFGAFCRLESKIEASSKVPLRFRLGSLDYVNYLEQKYVLKRPGKEKRQK